MGTQSSPKTVVCRDCGYELTIRTPNDEDIPSYFCERCGSQHHDISCFNELARHYPIQFLKNLLNTKIF